MGRLIQKDFVHVCHVGDVRCYVSSAGSLERITEDHSVVGHLMEMGVLTTEKAQNYQDQGRPHCRPAAGTKPDLNSRQLAPGDRILVCSDGLWDALPEEGIAAVLASEGSMRQVTTVLVERAIAAGADHDITSVVYEHEANPAIHCE